LSNAIDSYLKQNITWQKNLAKNKYNEPTYITSTIKGRLESAFRLVRNPQGEQVVSSGFVLTRSIISVDDKLDGRIVITSEPKYDLAGNVSHYEVYLL
jgi:hypothetical protein